MERLDDLPPQEIADNDMAADQLVLLMVVGSALFFAALNQALIWASRRYVTFQMTSEWRCRNLVVSWVHADVSAVWSFYCFFKYGQYITSLAVLFDIRPLAASLMVAFSVGYFFYDLLEHISQGKTFTVLEITVHHIAFVTMFGYNIYFHFSVSFSVLALMVEVVTMFGYNLYYHFCVSFSVLALMVEVNSVFLHGRKLLQMLGLPFQHALYRLVSALNLLSFLVFRGAAMVLIWSGFLSNLHRCSFVFTIALGVIMVFMVIMNGVLLWRLVSSDYLRRGGKKGKSREGSQEEKKKKNGGAVLMSSAALLKVDGENNGLPYTSNGYGVDAVGAGNKAKVS